jgi:uncharacterized coiled-coil protein SlyX
MAAGTDKVDNFETILVVMVGLAMSGLTVTAFAGWWLHDAVHTQADALDERADRLERRLDEQATTLAGVSGEVHHARADVARLHATVGQLRLELDGFIHGPPSLRAPVTNAEDRS